MTHPVTVVAASPSTNIDEYGTEVSVWVSTDVLACLQQKSRADREGYVPQGLFLLVLPPGTDIKARDIVIADGEEFAVSGPPAIVRNESTGLVHHVEASLTQTRGGEEGE